ncbi:hypothetical protein EDC01DRAFT_753427 [Geopyxis carbonaria]|nr:hypothetical protein EDC01DRAFT_753427 [Geopyxis carbonaria]
MSAPPSSDESGEDMANKKNLRTKPSGRRKVAKSEIKVEDEDSDVDLGDSGSEGESDVGGEVVDDVDDEGSGVVHDGHMELDMRAGHVQQDQSVNTAALRPPPAESRDRDRVSPSTFYGTRAQGHPVHVPAAQGEQRQDNPVTDHDNIKSAEEDTNQDDKAAKPGTGEEHVDSSDDSLPSNCSSPIKYDPTMYDPTKYDPTSYDPTEGYEEQDQAKPKNVDVAQQVEENPNPNRNTRMESCVPETVYAPSPSPPKVTNDPLFQLINSYVPPKPWDIAAMSDPANYIPKRSPMTTKQMLLALVSVDGDSNDFPNSCAQLRRDEDSITVATPAQPQRVRPQTRSASGSKAKEAKGKAKAAAECVPETSNDEEEEPETKPKGRRQVKGKGIAVEGVDYDSYEDDTDTAASKSAAAANKPKQRTPRPRASKRKAKPKRPPTPVDSDSSSSLSEPPASRSIPASHKANTNSKRKPTARATVKTRAKATMVHPKPRGKGKAVPKSPSMSDLERSPEPGEKEYLLKRLAALEAKEKAQQMPQKRPQAKNAPAKANAKRQRTAGEAAASASAADSRAPATFNSQNQRRSLPQPTTYPATAANINTNLPPPVPERWMTGGRSQSTLAISGPQTPGPGWQQQPTLGYAPRQWVNDDGPAGPFTGTAGTDVAGREHRWIPQARFIPHDPEEEERRRRENPPPMRGIFDPDLAIAGPPLPPTVQQEPPPVQYESPISGAVAQSHLLTNTADEMAMHRYLERIADAHNGVRTIPQRRPGTQGLGRPKGAKTGTGVQRQPTNRIVSMQNASGVMCVSDPNYGTEPQQMQQLPTHQQYRPSAQAAAGNLQQQQRGGQSQQNPQAPIHPGALPHPQANLVGQFRQRSVQQRPLSLEAVDHLSSQEQPNQQQQQPRTGYAQPPNQPAHQAVQQMGRGQPAQRGQQQQQRPYPQQGQPLPRSLIDQQRLSQNRQREQSVTEQQNRQYATGGQYPQQRPQQMSQGQQGQGQAPAQHQRGYPQQGQQGQQQRRMQNPQQSQQQTQSQQGQHQEAGYPDPVQQRRRQMQNQQGQNQQAQNQLRGHADPVQQGQQQMRNRQGPQRYPQQPNAARQYPQGAPYPQHPEQRQHMISHRSQHSQQSQQRFQHQTAEQMLDQLAPSLHVEPAHSVNSGQSHISRHLSVPPAPHSAHSGMSSQSAYTFAQHPQPLQSQQSGIDTGSSTPIPYHVPVPLSPRPAPRPYPQTGPAPPHHNVYAPATPNRDTTPTPTVMDTSPITFSAETSPSSYVPSSESMPSDGGLSPAEEQELLLATEQLGDLGPVIDLEQASAGFIDMLEGDAEDLEAWSNDFLARSGVALQGYTGHVGGEQILGVDGVPVPRIEELDTDDATERGNPAEGGNGGA